MRFAFAFLATFAVAGAAFAQTPAASVWSDPTGRISFENTAKWAMDDLTKGGEVGLFVGGTADEECRFLVIKNANTEGAKIARVKQALSQPLTNDIWVQAFQGRTGIGEGPTVTESGVDTSGAWPLRTAVLQSSANGAVNAVIAGRPGIEIRAYCLSFDGKNRQAAFKALLASIASPKDAAFAEQEASEGGPTIGVPAAPAPAAPEAPKPEAPKDGRKKP